MSELDEALRRHDPDRWLSSRFVGDPQKRSQLVALYALGDAWARVAAMVTTPLAGEIRLAWWRDAVEGFAAGGPAEHPALDALGRAAAADLQPLLQSAIEARHADLQPADAPDDVAMQARIDAGEGALMAAAARLLDPAASPDAIRHAARAWGWAQRRRPDRAAEALVEARGAVRGLSVAAFPAAAHVALATPYASGRIPGELEKRARVTWAVLRGRL